MEIKKIINILFNVLFIELSGGDIQGHLKWEGLDDRYITDDTHTSNSATSKEMK